MTKDFVLTASTDQSDLSNVRNVTKSVNYTCTAYPPCQGSSGSFASGSVVASTSGSIQGGVSTGSPGTSGAPATTPMLHGSPSSCTAAAPPVGRFGAGLGAAAAAVGLVAGRVLRRRRARRPS
jgi:hypothetical protein